MPMKFAVTAAALAVLTLAAPARAEDKEWNHAILAAKSDSGYLFMVNKGFAEKQGLKLTLTQVESDAIGIKALLAGQVDSYEGSPAGAMIAASRGADVKVMGCQWPGLPHGVFVRGGVATPQDLKGKTIAISQPGAMPDQLIRTLLRKYNVSVDDVKFANLGGDNDRYKALAAGVVDGAVISGEYTPIAEKAGVKLLVAARDVLPEYLRICLMTSGAVEKKRHDELVRFLAAEISAYRFAIAHPDETIVLTRATANINADDPRPAYIFDDAVKNHSLDPEIGLPADRLNWMQQQSVASGDQPKLDDLAIVTDGGPRKEALARAGN